MKQIQTELKKIAKLLTSGDFPLQSAKGAFPQMRGFIGLGDIHSSSMDKGMEKLRDWFDYISDNPEHTEENYKLWKDKYKKLQSDIEEGAKEMVRASQVLKQKNVNKVAKFVKDMGKWVK